MASPTLHARPTDSSELSSGAKTRSCASCRTAHAAPSRLLSISPSPARRITGAPPRALGRLRSRLARRRLWLCGSPLPRLCPPRPLPWRAPRTAAWFGVPARDRHTPPHPFEVVRKTQDVGSQRLIERGNCRWELPQNLVHQSRRNPHHGRACTSRGGCGTHRVDKQSRLADDGTGLGNENGRPVTSIERNRALYHNKTTVRGIALAEEDVALL